MAGFLNCLAARALGAMPLAEPVIPARFTPESRLASRHPFDSDSGPALEGTPAHPESFRRPADQFPHPAEIIPVETAPTKHKQLSFSHEQPDEPAYRPQFVPNYTPRSLLAECQAPRSLQAFPEPDRPAGDKASIQSAHAEDSSAHEKPIPADSLRDKLSNQRATAPNSAELIQHSRLAPSREPIRSPAVRPLPLNPVAPTTTQPIVRVTIGRIEVRAEISAPPTSSASVRPQRATLSLDQFLKQTGSGAR